MPLLTSPIDGSPMRQIHRYGIEIDVCPTSGGIWLDKGELEKLMHLLKEETAAEQSNYSPNFAPRDSYDEKYTKKYHKKESKMSRIMDLFDF